VIYSYDKSQQDALCLNFILVKNSTCLMYVCPCIMYENDERYQLDATILFVIINKIVALIRYLSSTLHVSDRLTVHHQMS
jgi:hypothetical protein